MSGATAETVASSADAGLRDGHSHAPSWAGPDGFHKYEYDMLVWQYLTTLPTDKKGGVMRMALTSVAAEAARQVSVVDLITTTGHETLLGVLRMSFGGSDGQRRHAAYRRLRGLYRGDKSMEESLAAMGVTLADCRNHGYAMSAKMGAAITLDQADLDASQQASTTALAASLGGPAGSDDGAIATALRDLWGGKAVLKSSPGAAMMVITYAQHQALTARQTTPRPRPRGSRWAPTKDGDVECWHCGITGHIRRDCHKRLAKEKAQGAAGGVGGGNGPGGSPALADRADGGGGEATYAVTHKCHLVLARAGGVNAFSEDPVGHVILDIGATATFAGMAWVAAYVARLDSASRPENRSVDASCLLLAAKRRRAP